MPVRHCSQNGRDLLEIPRRQLLGRVLSQLQSLPGVGGLAGKALRVARKRFISRIKSLRRSEWIDSISQHPRGREFHLALQVWSRRPSEPIQTAPYPRRPESRRCTVIINTVDRAEELEKTLQDLKAEWNADLDELVIVLGPSEDSSADVIRRSPVPCQMIQCPVRNLAVSRNLGLGVASGRFVAFIDDDASPAPRWLERLLQPMEKDLAVGISAGFVRDGIGKGFLNRCVVADTLGRAFWLEDLASARQMIDQIGADRAFLTATGCNMAFRRSALDSIGGFDPFYQYFLEETDVVRLLITAGYHCEIAPESQVWHRLASNLARRPSLEVNSRIVIARSQIHYIGKFGKSTFSTADIESCIWERVLLDMEKIAWDCGADAACGELQQLYLSRITEELRLDSLSDSSSLLSLATATDSMRCSDVTVY